MASNTPNPNPQSNSSSSSSTTAPSPGNAFSPNPTTTPPMRLPSLSFLYRMECDCASDADAITVGAPHDGGAVRTVMPIIGGVVRGPRIEAEVLSAGGADWMEVWAGTHVSFNFSLVAGSLGSGLFICPGLRGRSGGSV